MDSNIIRPKSLVSRLTSGGTEGTLTGGKAGQDNAKHPHVSIVETSPSQAESLGTALDALSAMFCGYVGNDRALLDSGFEDLVSIIEEWRDAVPKAT